MLLCSLLPLYGPLFFRASYGYTVTAPYREMVKILGVLSE